MLSAHPARAAWASTLEGDDPASILPNQVVDRDNVSAIEPHLEHGTVASEDFFELLAVSLIVGGLFLRRGRPTAIASPLCIVARTQVNSSRTPAAWHALASSATMSPLPSFQGEVLSE